MINREEKVESNWRKNQLHFHLNEIRIKLAQTECSKKSPQSKNAKEECLVQNTERQQNRIPMTRSTGKWGARLYVIFE